MDRSAVLTTTRRDEPQSVHTAAFVLIAVSLGFFMILLDGSALNIALPALQQELHGSLAGLQWVITIYTIPLAGLLLTSGNLSDRIGSRQLFLWALAMFSAASLLCAVSPSLEFLVGARAFQGVAAAGVLPTTLSIITGNYPDPIERAKAITVWGAVGGVALVVGPIGGGVLTDLLGWRSIFLINVPIGLITTVLIARYARETQRRASQPPDIWGQLTGVIALSALVAGLIEADSLGWESTVTAALLLIAVVAGIGFFVIEKRIAFPMLPLAMFRHAAFSASITNGFAFQFGAYGLQFMLAIYVQQQWHLGAGAAGLLFLPFSLCWVFGTVVLNRRLVHRGPRWLLWTGALTAVVGSLVLLGVSGPQTWMWFAAGTALVGLGCGVLGPSLAAAAMLSVEATYSGLGSGVLNTARQVGMAVGIALLGAFLAVRNPVLGMRMSVALIAACFLVIVVLSVRYVPRKEGSQ